MSMDSTVSSSPSALLASSSNAKVSHHHDTNDRHERIAEAFHNEQSDEEEVLLENFDLVQLVDRTHQLDNGIEGARLFGQSNNRRCCFTMSSWRDGLEERLQNCDPWKVIPTIVVSNAFSCSVTVLTLCTLAEMRVAFESDPISFGLWTYSDPDRAPDGTLVIPSAVDFTRTCRSYADNEGGKGPPESLIGDAKFRTARACGVLAVVIGFWTMSALWIGVLRDAHDFSSKTTAPSRWRSPPKNWKKWVGGMLFLCCFLEAMTLLVLQSGVCDSQNTGFYENCMQGEGFYTVLLACFFWFLGGILLLKWPQQQQPATRQKDPQYVHSTLARDEAEEGLHPLPEMVGEPSDESLFDFVLKSLEDESEQVTPNTLPVDEETNDPTEQDNETTPKADETMEEAKSSSSMALSLFSPPQTPQFPSMRDLWTTTTLEQELTSTGSNTMSFDSSALATGLQHPSFVTEAKPKSEGSLQPRPPPRAARKPASLDHLREQSAIHTTRQQLRDSMKDSTGLSCNGVRTADSKFQIGNYKQEKPGKSTLRAMDHSRTALQTILSDTVPV